MSLTFFYKITDKGRDFMRKIDDAAPHFNSEQWKKYAPMADVLHILDRNIGSRMHMAAIGKESPWDRETRHKAVHTLVRNGFVICEGQVDRSAKDVKGKLEEFHANKK